MLIINCFACGLTRLNSNLNSFFSSMSKTSNAWLVNSFSSYHSNLQSPLTEGAIKQISQRQSKSISQIYNRKPNTLCREGLLKEALASMCQRGRTALDCEAYGFLLQACMDTKSVSQGNQLHAHMLINGIEQETILKTKLLSFYVACGRMEDARLIFNRMCQRNVFLWNEMIRGYAWNDPCEEALALYYQMEQVGVHPNNFTYPFVLKACAGLSALQEGRDIHYHVVKSGLEMDVYVASALIDMYGKCGDLENASKIFDKMPKRDVVSWNALIAGYAQNGYAEEALALYNQMQLADVKPTSVTMVSVLPACAQVAALQQGKLIHQTVIRCGFESHVSVGTALMDMYAKCGSAEIARLVFDRMPQRNAISWTAMIAGYAQNGYSNDALVVFRQMQLANMTPDSGSIVSVLRACALLGALWKGKCIHAYVIRKGINEDVNVGNSLVAMYAKCGSIDIALQCFDNMPKRDVVSWNAIIAGYSQNGHAYEALRLFQQMQKNNVKPDMTTVVCVLPSCAHLAALQQGKLIHGHILRNGLEMDVSTGNALIDMYAKCGRLEIARRLFEKMPKKDVVSWNVMILGYGLHGQSKDAIALFSHLEQMGMKPDDITFICILSACSHAGLVDEGRKYFNRLNRDHCIAPRMEHYICMVDLLGRAGYLSEAQELINMMPFEPDASVWGALLGACRIHCNIELAEYVAKHHLKLESNNTGCYVLLSNIYAAAGRWHDAAKVRTLIKTKGLKKNPGRSWIEIKSSVHTFVGGDRSHPQSEKIYAVLDNLIRDMKKEGYVHDKSFVLQDVEEEEKENIISTHSEKLAIAFGLFETSPGMPIQITKNLRVCGDCHNATKFVSKIAKREIVLRDINRFHHFKDGVCSCGDFW